MLFDLLPFIERFGQCKVLCVGDVMLDKFVYGSVDRISPEAPIPVFSLPEERAMLGGAGNVARNLAALGAHSSFVSVIGDDAVGRTIASMVGKEPQLSPYMVTETGRVSTTKTRFVSGNHQMLRADYEVNSPLLESSSKRLSDIIVEESASHDVLLLSDYGKGLFDRAMLARIIDAAKTAGKPVIVDPKSRDFSLYRGATCVSPNLRELANAAAREVKSEDDIIDVARQLIEAHDIEYLLVTRSKDGMTLVARSGAIHHIPTHAQEVYDVSGAGDTAVATLALAVGCGMDWPDAAILANVAAGIVVGRLGTAIVTAQDLKNALVTQGQESSIHKIVPLSVAAAHVEQWKREGKVVGFTNGCFDLMHSGHLALLHKTRAHCDKLIVGVNSDASVKRLNKGDERPLNGEMDRAHLLASLGAVDQVIIFSEDTPLTLIKTLKPDVLAKGADYQKHQVVGHEIVESYGGKVVLIPLKEGYSTTNIIKKMA